MIRGATRMEFALHMCTREALFGKAYTIANMSNLWPVSHVCPKAGMNAASTGR